jgi:LysM repeat protein
MRSYRYCKPDKKTSNRVVLKSYTQKLGAATSFVFSKPVFMTATAMMFVASNYFLVTAFSQVSKASSAEPFRIYSSNNKVKKIENINYIANPEFVKELKFEVYIVEKGDTLSAISKKTKDSLAELIENNKLNGNFMLRIGQPLKVIKD